MLIIKIKKIDNLVRGNTDNDNKKRFNKATVYDDCTCNVYVLTD